MTETISKTICGSFPALGRLGACLYMYMDLLGLFIVLLRFVLVGSAISLVLI